MLCTRSYPFSFSHPVKSLAGVQQSTHTSFSTERKQHRVLCKILQSTVSRIIVPRKVTSTIVLWSSESRESLTANFCALCNEHTKPTQPVNLHMLLTVLKRQPSKTFTLDLLCTLSNRVIFIFVISCSWLRKNCGCGKPTQ